jgi:hypothetical protein
LRKGGKPHQFRSVQKVSLAGCRKLPSEGAHWQVEKQGEQPLEESMRNITVTIPDDVYLRARVWAAERDTSVSAVVKYLLETMPGMKRSNLAFPARNSNPVKTSASSPTPPTQ